MKKRALLGGLRNAHIGACSVAYDAAALGMQSPSIHVDSTSLKPSELAFGTHEKKSIGAMDCYVTVQEYGKHLTAVAELPLIVLVVTVTVLLPSMYIPPPCKGEDALSSFIALHWGHGRRSEKVWITGIQKSEHCWEVSNFAECSHRP
jgi:hypothetical protein